MLIYIVVRGGQWLVAPYGYLGFLCALKKRFLRPTMRWQAHILPDVTKLLEWQFAWSMARVIISGAVGSVSCAESGCVLATTMPQQRKLVRQ